MNKHEDHLRSEELASFNFNDVDDDSIKQEESCNGCTKLTQHDSARAFWKNSAIIGKYLREDTYLGLDINGKEVTLADYRGQKVMICFYLFTQCGVCAYSIGKLAGTYKKLAWASKLKVVTIFRTEVQHLQAGLTDCNSPIPKLLNCEQCETAYPFDALADPDGRAAESFDCNTSSIFKTLKMNRKSAPKMCKRLLTSSMVRKEALFAARHGAGNLLPSEFLIDGRGKVVDIMRATKSNEHMTSERISNFLLEGEMKKILSSSTSLPIEDAESMRKRIMERRGSAFL